MWLCYYELVKIIDLTLPLYTGMPVYPGDMEARIEPVQSLETDGWNMRRIEMNTHDGTHVNAPIHGILGGNTLDEYPLEAFCGRARLYKPGIPMTSDTGIIFHGQNIDWHLFEEIKKARPRFIGLSSEYEIDEKIEKELFKEGIMLFERLANTETLPDECMFYGMPLKILGGDGSPVRAFAIID